MVSVQAIMECGHLMVTQGAQGSVTTMPAFCTLGLGEK